MTHTLLTRARVPALALAVALSLAACGGDDEGGHDMAGMSGEASGAPSDPASDPAFNAADVMFAQMMLPHHEQAIEMSDAVLGKDGIDPRVADLAEQIKVAQGPEIETLTGWLADWGAEPAAPGHGSMDGMLSPDDLGALDDAQGVEAERLFLEQMVEHHEGAVEMAQAEVEDGQDADAVAMARSVVETQSDEIHQMRDLLASR